MHHSPLMRLKTRKSTGRIGRRRAFRPFLARFFLFFATLAAARKSGAPGEPFAAQDFFIADFVAAFSLRGRQMTTESGFRVERRGMLRCREELGGGRGE